MAVDEGVRNSMIIGVHGWSPSSSTRRRKKEAVLGAGCDERSDGGDPNDDAALLGLNDHDFAS